MEFFKMRMNLQFFADPEDGAGSEGDGGGSGAEPMSFDDFLKGEGNQAEFDRRMNKAIETAVKNAQDKWQLMTDDKVSEAEKLAKMNKEEKAAYMLQKEKNELSAREAAVTKKELMAEAKGTLAEKKLPVSLAEILDYKDAETCKTSIETVEKAFQEAVQAAVEQKLKGGTPPQKAPEEGDDLAKQVERLMLGM